MAARRRRRRESLWVANPICLAWCNRCLADCIYPPRHVRSHGAHHEPGCRGGTFHVQRVCKKCGEIQIQEDWDICRPCALLVELLQTRDLPSILRVARELFQSLPGYRRRLFSLLPPG